jgi:hypothetical protein
MGMVNVAPLVQYRRKLRDMGGNWTVLCSRLATPHLEECRAHRDIEILKNEDPSDIAPPVAPAPEDAAFVTDTKATEVGKR